MKKKRILAVDDEVDILEILKFHLSRDGYEVVTAKSGEDALQTADIFNPDLILLDLMLPGIDGLTTCRKLKSSEKTQHIPIIMLTAKGDESDIVAGLEFGADDYITKPFSSKIVSARIKALLRRTGDKVAESNDTVQVAGLFMNPQTREVTFNGESLKLTYSEFEILFLLSGTPGRVYTRNQIVNKIKGGDYPVTERSIDVQIVSLRKKLKGSSGLIETIRGVGYKFKSQ